MRVYQQDGKWQGAKGGVVGLVRVLGVEPGSSFRSLGLADKAVLIEINLGGYIENITTVDGCYVDSITIPPTHGLYASTVLVTEEPVCS